jgi:hypothetical protein
MRVDSKITSLSWIPSEAVKGYMKTVFSLGLSHYDSPPPDVLHDLEALRQADGFRFANRLRAWAVFGDDGRVADYDTDGGLVMGSTIVRLGPLGASYAAIPLPDLRGEPEVGDGWIRFTQTCGGRTALPLPRTIAQAPFVRLQSPLVWTTLTVTLHRDGRAEATLAGASPFPRHWVYGADDQLILKAGTTDWQGWTGQRKTRTPWGDEDSPVVVTAAETALERQLSTLIMRGGARPRVQSLAEGSVLVKQGDPGGSLFLLLDGVLRVEVDGRPLVELGPGAVLGERAVLEGGRRTATLTAVTPGRVAAVPGSSIDQEALRQLAEGHRREGPRA